jgi:hypothetical protein
LIVDNFEVREIIQVNSLKIGWILMLILGIYRTAIAILLAAGDVGDISANIGLATTGIAIIGITLGSYRKGEKWSWWLLLIIGLIPFLDWTFLHEFNPLLLIGWILFILALLIPAKAILGKKSI